MPVKCRPFPAPAPAAPLLPTPSAVPGLGGVTVLPVAPGHGGHDPGEDLAIQAVRFQVYTFHDPDGREYAFAVNAGLQIATQREEIEVFSPSECGITLAEVQSRYEGGLDMEHVRNLPATYIYDPLLFVTWRGKHLLIDGWHRLTRALLDGVDLLPAYILSPEDTARILL